MIEKIINKLGSSTWKWITLFVLAVLIFIGFTCVIMGAQSGDNLVFVIGVIGVLGWMRNIDRFHKRFFTEVENKESED